MNRYKFMGNIKSEKIKMVDQELRAELTPWAVFREAEKQKGESDKFQKFMEKYQPGAEKSHPFIDDYHRIVFRKKKRK